MKRVITAEVVAAEHAAGRRRIVAPAGAAVVTPEAWSRAGALGVTIDTSAAAPKREEPVRKPLSARKGRAERVVDASGVLVVRGRSIELGEFDGAGPGRNIGLTDLVTGKDGSPMTAGVMSWSREDSFPWKLDYDEVDLVLEGVLEITIEGRTLRGTPGDVFYIPKGSRIVFGTPSRTRVFYVTYPADWAAASNAPPRPRKAE